MVGRRGFTVWELAALVGAVGVIAVFVVVMFMPLCGGGRDARDVVSRAHMHSLALGAANYAELNDDLIFSFTWPHAGHGRADVPSGLKEMPFDPLGGSAAQLQHILQRGTGRVRSAPGGFESAIHPLPRSVIWAQRWSHVVMLDTFTDVQPEPIAASPYDKDLQHWQEDPLSYLRPGSGVPYAEGMPGEPGWEVSPVWGDEAVRAMWAFGSSYQVVPQAWLDDEDPVYVPRAESPHGMRLVGEADAPLGGRRMSEVAFPSRKVFMYEEFDRVNRFPDAMWVGYDDAVVNLAFFDGSVRQERVGDARSARDEGDADRVWKQRYVPLDGFPEPLGGLGEEGALDLRFRWTVGGLKGWDFGG